MKYEKEKEKENKNICQLIESDSSHFYLKFRLEKLEFHLLMHGERTPRAHPVYQQQQWYKCFSDIPFSFRKKILNETYTSLYHRHIHSRYTIQEHDTNNTWKVSFLMLSILMRYFLLLHHLLRLEWNGIFRFDPKCIVKFTKLCYLCFAIHDKLSFAVESK